MAFVPNNMVFVLEPALTQSSQLDIADLEALIKANGGNSTLRVKTVEVNPKTQEATLELPNGQRFTAKLPDNVIAQLPKGARLLMQVLPQGSGQQAPVPTQGQPPVQQPQQQQGQVQLLQVTDSRGQILYPPTAGTIQKPQGQVQNQIQNQGQQQPVQATLSTLLGTNVGAKAGMRIRMLPMPQAQGNNPQAIPNPTQVKAPLPPVGATAWATISGPPENGMQPITLASGVKSRVPLPPIFTVGAQVMLKMTASNQAEILTVQPAAPEASKGTPAQNQAASQSVSQPVSQTSKQPAPSAPSAPPLPSTAPAADKASQQPPRLPSLDLLNPLPKTLSKDVLQALQSQAGLKVSYRVPDAPTQKGQPSQPPQLVIKPEQVPSLKANVTLPLKTPLQLAVGSELTIKLAPQSSQQVQVLKLDVPPAQQTAQLQATQPQAQASSQPVSQTANLQPPQVVVAKVIAAGPTPDVYTLKFKEGVQVQVLSPQPLPTGSRVSLALLPSGHAHIIDVLPTATQGEISHLLKYASSLPSLTNALNQLKFDAPEAYEHAKSQLPRLGPDFTPKLIQFLEAAATQNASKMLGDEVMNLLRSFGLDGALQSDLGNIHSLNQQKVDGENWRSLFFPYWDEVRDDAQQGQMYWRKQKDENKRDQLRFIVHLSLSHLGALQLDGLLNGGQANFKLRMQERPDQAFIQELREVVTTALDEAGIQGSISVEVVSRFDTNPLKDILKNQRGLDVKV